MTWLTSKIPHSYKYIGKKSVHWTQGEIYRVACRLEYHLKGAIKMRSNNTDCEPIVWDVRCDGNWKEIR